MVQVGDSPVINPDGNRSDNQNENQNQKPNQNLNQVPNQVPNQIPNQVPDQNPPPLNPFLPNALIVPEAPPRPQIIGPILSPNMQVNHSKMWKHIYSR